MCSADVPKGCDRNGGGISVAAAGLTDAEPRGSRGSPHCLGGLWHLCRSRLSGSGGGDTSRWVWLLVSSSEVQAVLPLLPMALMEN